MKNGWVKYKNGTQKHYVNNKLHNDNGPAIISKSRKEWYRNNKRHREDGPAIENISGHDPYIEYWIKGHYITGKKREFNAIKRGKLVINCDQYKRTIFYKNYKIHKEDGPADFTINKKTNKVESEYWFWNGLLHREDGPAFIRKSWSRKIEMWYLHGELHRLDGPAEYIKYRGNKPVMRWLKNDNLHRLDGPAVIFPKYKLFFIDGKQINCTTIKQFKKLLKLKVFW